MYDEFWKWLYKLSKRKVKEAHLKTVGSDIKCPNCKQWFSVSGVEHKHSHMSEPEFGFHIKCGACGHESYWNAVAAPVLLRCDENGTPLK